MKLKADVRCYMCARVAGTLEWEPRVGGSAVFRPRVHAHAGTAHSLSDIRCPSCGGQTYLDEIEEIRVREPVQLFPAKRGRPRKHPLPQSVPA